MTIPVCTPSHPCSFCQDEEECWTWRKPVSYFAELQEQLQRNIESDMVSYVDATLNRLYWHAVAHPEVLPEGTTIDDYKASLNEQLASIWNYAAQRARIYQQCEHEFRKTGFIKV